jgi:AraC-like DNA-binding protein
VTHGTLAVPVAFSTAGLPEGRRVQLWESHNATALIGLRCRTLSAALLDATEINVQLERIQLARVRGNSHVVERDQALIRHRPADSVALFFSLVGEAFFYDEDGVRVVQPGEMLLCDADRPFMRGFSQGLEELVLKLPRAVFAEVTGIDQIARPMVVKFAAGANQFAHTLAREVGGATRAGDPRRVDEGTLLELVAALAGADRDDLFSAHRAAAQTYIDHNLFTAALSAPQVATAVGISPRHLSRVFADAGLSVPQYILARRLEAARSLLQQPEASSMTIGQVARRCGFTSPAHFSSAFSTRFGERASDVRRRALGSRTSPPA